MASIERCASHRELGLLKRARVRWMESVARPLHARARHASRTVVPKLTRLTTSPTFHIPRDANRAGVHVKASLPTDDAQSAVWILRKRETEPDCERRVSRRPRSRLEMGPSGPFPRSKADRKSVV